MKLLENILLAVDFADKENQSLIDTTANLAKIFNSSVVAINVIPEKTDDKEVSKYLRSYANENMEKLEAKLLEKGIDKLSTHVISGNPFERILETSEKEDYNVILAGSGKNGESNKPGVTVRKLIRKTSVPVWVVKPDKAFSVNNILCPVDFSEASKRALSNAILLASKMHARLRVLSVYDPIELVSSVSIL
jgi:nucleotide-binding universal stress UspA family protein